MDPPANPSAGSSAVPGPQRQQSKVGRKRSLSKPERQRPKTGMLNRTPSTKAHEIAYHESNDSTGNLLQTQNTGGSSSSSNGPGSAAATAQEQQQQQRLRLQQANQQQRPRGPRRTSTLQRSGTRKSTSDPQRRPSKVKKKIQPEREVEITAWVIVSRIFTCCIPSSLLRCCNAKKFSKVQVIQAWREKVTLCIIIALICTMLAFVIFGLQPTLCPTDSRARFSYSTEPQDGRPAVKNNHTDSVLVRGSVYSFNEMSAYLRSLGTSMSADFRARDITPLFYDSARPCARYPSIITNNTQCVVPNPYNNTALIAKPCIPMSDLANNGPIPRGKLSFLWTDLDDKSRTDLDNFIIYDGKIFDVTNFLGQNQVFGAEVYSVMMRSLRKDSSLLFQRTDARKRALDCIQAVAEVGVLENTTMGCFASKVIILTTLICVCMVVGIKFLMALTFSWFLSYRLTEKPRNIKLKSSKNEKDGATSASAAGLDVARGKNAATRKNLYTVMLVTCYSEGESSIRTTLDSLANTSYSTKHKLLMVICDGLVRGHGNTMTTPDIVVNMLELAPGNEEPKPASYLAIADGEKQHNMAKVYAGHYVYKKKRVPTVVIVKCGNPLEKDATKPGNRGKRDSQLILMSFFQRVLFADRFTELDFELFNKIHSLMNVWPDRFELCLMVDADTMVKGDSLSYMVTAMQNDTTIMGLCGETKIANKTASWVTAIQVFEYYISHHLGKAFESVFGGVTCLPGCFCMYRIKAPKNESWVPILANPEVIQEYNQNIVSTLHQKNLLLLGEDRYLTTLMLRTFPKRQMVFVPQAQCKTVVPDTFSVLLSQRRRWINSTVHNLLELVLVTDLCGIAFLSMQFVVLLELIGTVVLPAAILFLIGMVVYAIVAQSVAWLPLVLTITILGLPAVLIVLTTRKWIYILWMFIYLFSLPIWNFVLPLYAFWHFDDFSWGETRKVANQKRKSGQDHGDAEGVFESGSIIMRKWEEWEKERLKAMGYRIQRRRSADRGINDLPPPAASTMDLHRSPTKLGGGNGTVGRMSAIAAASTNSLGSTLNGSAGSLRTGPNTLSRQITSGPMPQSTPNLLQQQQQPPVPLQHRQSMGMRPRPRPSIHMPMPRPPPGSLSPGVRPVMSLDGQAFELGPMASGPAPGRVSYMPQSPPGQHGQLPPGMDPRLSMRPGPPPMGSPRPMYMRPMMGGPPSPGMMGPGMMGPGMMGPGGGPGPRPRPPFPGGPPAVSHPPPALLFPQQQQGSAPGGLGASHPAPPGTPAMIPGDRRSRASEMSGQSTQSSGARSAAHGSVGTTGANNNGAQDSINMLQSAPVPAIPRQHSYNGDASSTTNVSDKGDEEDGIVVLSDEFHVPTMIKSDSSNNNDNNSKNANAPLEEKS